MSLVMAGSVSGQNGDVKVSVYDLKAVNPNAGNDQDTRRCPSFKN